MLEASQHEQNSFCTLTYDDARLPADLSVTPREVALFFKRFRKMLDRPVRYFAVGEYGDNSGRPHYHLALFGYPFCTRGRTDLRRTYCCETCDLVAKAWGKGAIETAPLERGSAQYVAGYVVKKWTRQDDPRLEGRLPEFARMSLRPGLGLFSMHEVASVLLDQTNLERYVDVPLALQHGARPMPLGRYLRRKLRTYIGRDERTPDVALEIQKEQLRPLQETAFNNSTSFREEILKASEGKRINLEARNRVKKRNI